MPAITSAEELSAEEPNRSEMLYSTTVTVGVISSSRFLSIYQKKVALNARRPEGQMILLLLQVSSSTYSRARGRRDSHKEIHTLRRNEPSYTDIGSLPAAELRLPSPDGHSGCSPWSPPRPAPAPSDEVDSKTKPCPRRSSSCVVPLTSRLPLSTPSLLPHPSSTTLMPL